MPCKRKKIFVFEYDTITKLFTKGNLFVITFKVIKNVCVNLFVITFKDMKYVYVTNNDVLSLRKLRLLLVCQYPFFVNYVANQESIKEKSENFMKFCDKKVYLISRFLRSRWGNCRGLQKS